jgi:cytochrome c peroxidase
MKRKTYTLITLLFIIAGLIILPTACKKDPTSEPAVEQDNTPYILSYGSFPAPAITPDNLLSNAGVFLGRMLFYEPMLSKDGSMTCASCHNQNNAFDDTARFSTGVRGLKGGRQAMAIFNMAWNTNNFFWDGRAELLRHQATKPIQDPLEMDESIENVIAKLSSSQKYKDHFIRAFGSADITELTISLALEQFMNSIVSYQSKYDDFLANKVNLTPSENRGRKLFLQEYNQFIPDSSGADCAHCHSGFNFENDRYMNNGLDATFTDSGRAKATLNSRDVGKFKVVSLRNIALTAPYMHDGRFQTLEQVLEHYNNGVKASSTLDPAMEQTRATGLRLDVQDKLDLIAFLNTLTDQQFINNSEYTNPH